MSAIDIVNMNIKLLEKMLYELKDTKVGTIEDFKKHGIECELREHKQIKNDLEVLNILKNKEVDIFLLKDALKSHKYDIEGALKFYNNEFIEEYQLTLDEIDTIDRWLRRE